ncbi:MAG: hypothetical protein LC658_12900 [Bacteroidales bacterium]|nr:hypothetical protein [Bacteroidales bacterium]
MGIGQSGSKIGKKTGSSKLNFDSLNFIERESFEEALGTSIPISDVAFSSFANKTVYLNIKCDTYFYSKEEQTAGIYMFVIGFSGTTVPLSVRLFPQENSGSDRSFQFIGGLTFPSNYTGSSVNFRFSWSGRASVARNFVKVKMWYR